MEIQTVIVTLIIASAVFYALNQVYKKIRSATGNGSCETSCGKCKSK